MKLHWSPRSPFVRKVMALAIETGLEARIETVRSPVAFKSPNAALMLDNPLNKLPTLVRDDGTALFDSGVICEYLDTLHGGTPFFPKDGDARWQALRWQALADGFLDLCILWRNERDRKLGAASDELLAAFHKKGIATLDRLELEVPALRAPPFGIGQLALACAVGYLDFRFQDLEWRKGRPALAAWYEEMARRPSLQRTVPVDA